MKNPFLLQNFHDSIPSGKKMKQKRSEMGEKKDKMAFISFPHSSVVSE